MVINNYLLLITKFLFRQCVRWEAIFFCGLTFPFHDSHATLILGGWGGSLIGISSIDDFDASENETGDVYIFEDNQWYDIKLWVGEEKILVWIDGEIVIDYEVDGHKVAMRFGEIEISVPFGFSTYATTGVIKKYRNEDWQREVRNHSKLKSIYFTILQ